MSRKGRSCLKSIRGRFRPLVDQAQGQLEPGPGAGGAGRGSGAADAGATGTGGDQREARHAAWRKRAPSRRASSITRNSRRRKPRHPSVRRRRPSMRRAPMSAAAQAAVTTAKLNLGFTEVRSLIGGVAGQATTQVGQSGGPAIRIDFGLATRSDQSLLLHQRQRISGPGRPRAPGRRRSSARPTCRLP